jgi:hypothetical protein
MLNTTDTGPYNLYLTGSLSSAAEADGAVKCGTGCGGQLANVVLVQRSEAEHISRLRNTW